MNRIIKIAIDGPAGSGKSTIAKIIAERYNILYVDSGAMYRAVTYNCLKNKINFDISEEIVNVCYRTEISLVKTEEKLLVYVNGEDVSEQIRTRDVTNNVFKIAREPLVRKHLVKLQQDYATTTSVIMDGRDIGTVVYPDADLKIYLDASVDERTHRRYEELKLKGENVNFEKLKQEVIDRDNQDKSRKVGPLKIAEDAVVLDTTGLNILQVTEKIVEIMKIKKII
ncbi:(d)CMP kinase [Candidatus Dependentiae bacterium]|nr:(d)CMP kinase [Candidatus Dependentiae bacterium]